MLHLQPPIKNLLVDLDGTLLANRNIPLSLDFARQALGALKGYGGWRKAVRTLLAMNREFQHPSSREATNNERVVEIFARRMNLSIEEGRRVLREGIFRIFPSLERHFYPVKGAKEFLDWAKDHFPLTLATNPVWPQEIVELRVRWAGIDPAIFSTITHVRLMHACKPDPSYFNEILALQKFQAEDCLLIGDHLKMDLPATRVGIRVFIVGPYPEITPLKISGAKALAWKGSYLHLRKILEHGLFERDAEEAAQLAELKNQRDDNDGA